jgi:hypothetical protein
MRADTARGPLTPRRRADLVHVVALALGLAVLLTSPQCLAPPIW